MISRSIAGTHFLRIFDERSRESYYGCDQEWYATERQRLSGCGPTAACNLIWYLNRTLPTLRLNQSCGSKASSISFLQDIWTYVTPSAKGIPTMKMFSDAVMAYAKSKGLSLERRSCDVPEERSLRPVFAGIVNFLEEALSKDAPVAFLNLCNGEEKRLEPWHWVTIIALQWEEENSRASVDILDGGSIKSIDLSLWYNTTTLGGGFVYFTASPVQQQSGDRLGTR